ncbi:hypothetical protein ABW19_dt0202688 [Dactylella cylindrospora]|nr:hypothetical protein ABW19_dt0202688 [Dactylella cylindrospora]
MSNYLGKLNKTQLAELARPLGIKHSTALKKQDLIDQIESELQSKRATLENDDLFKEYYETLPTDSAVALRSVTPKTTARRRSRYSKAPEDDEPGYASSEPPADAVTPAKKTTKSVTRSTRKSVAARAPASPDVPIDAEPIHPLSPAKLARSFAVSKVSFNTVGNAVSDWFAGVAKTTGFWEHVDFTRETLSDPKAIHAIIASYELAWLCHDLVPWTTVSIPVIKLPIPYFDITTGPTFVKYPDLFILLTWHDFWAPVLYWFTLGISFPLLASYFVNIRKRTTYDPLTFSITKALIAYLVYTKQLIRPEIPGVFTADTPVLISSCIGDETPLIGAAIGGLLTLWEAIISRR